MLLRYTAYDLNNSLSVAAKIYDYTSGSPVFVATIAMPSSGVNGSYVLSYEPVEGKIYFANMMVYTDSTFVTPDTSYTPADAEINGQENLNSGGSECGEVIGLVNTIQNIIGFVNNPAGIVGFVNCDCA